MIEALLLQVVPMPPPVSDWLVALIVAVTPVVVAIVGWLVKNFGSKLPSWLKPILATGLGALAAYLSGLHPENPLLLAAIGLAAIGLREIVNQLGQVFGVFPKKG